MKRIVGLGNPGPRYANTRHNVGWWVLDHLADVWRFPPMVPRGQALVSAGHVDGVPVELVAPQTWMNLSGRALDDALANPAFDPRADLLVLVDEVAIPAGRLRVRPHGSAGGHNGLKDVERAVGHAHYARLRVGVGPTDPAVVVRGLADYVLADVPADEAVRIRALMPAIEGACRTWVTDGVVAAANRFNNARAPEPEAPAKPAADGSAPPAPPDAPASPDATP
jgi:PTH1 family peptidyl-tRNA hydrolase